MLEIGTWYRQDRKNRLPELQILLISVTSIFILCKTIIKFVLGDRSLSCRGTKSVTAQGGLTWKAKEKVIG
jgi:hypothetical protein